MHILFFFFLLCSSWTKIKFVHASRERYHCMRLAISIINLEHIPKDTLGVGYNLIS